MISWERRTPVCQGTDKRAAVEKPLNLLFGQIRQPEARHSGFAVSVGIEDIEPADWTDRVYKPDIIGKRHTLYKQPGYNPL